LQECNIEEVPDEEEPPSKSSKDKKVNGPDTKAPSLVFKMTSKVPYKTVLKGMHLIYTYLVDFLTLYFFLKLPLHF
jgi:dynamin GTPase